MIPIPVKNLEWSLPLKTLSYRRGRRAGMVADDMLGLAITLFQGEPKMLRWAVIFLLIALVAGALGLWGLEGTAMQIARILFFVFLVLFIVSLVTGRRGPVD